MPAAAAAGAAAVDQYQQHMPISSSNVLLCMIDDVAYTPTVEALHTIFSTYGYVQKITIFEKSGNWQVSRAVSGKRCEPSLFQVNVPCFAAPWQEQDNTP